MPYITNDGYNIFYNHANLESKKTLVVFIHGWLLNSNCYKKYFEELNKKNIPYIYFDLRGHGKSDNPLCREDFTFEKIAEDLKLILDFLNINKKIILFGYSMGGMVSLNFYNKYPQLVKKMFLLNTSYKYPRSLHFGKIDINLTKSLEKKIYSYIIKFAENKKYDHNSIILFFRDKGSLKFNDKKFTYKNLTYGLDEIFSFNFSRKIKKFKIPIIFILADNDLFFDYKKIQKFCKNNKNINFYIYEGNHQSVVLHSEKLISIFKFFFKY
jgi:pimeloyl-ACP methyl ester carboxylesterase